MRFVTIGKVTVPGKGGRPRKWRSDADRVRAFRARQRGDAEPPVLAVALDEGDELAAAWEHVRQLGQQLDGQREVERALRSELGLARLELKAQERQFAWLRADNDDLRLKLAEVESERRESDERLSVLADENRALRQRLDRLQLDARSSNPGGGTPPDGRVGNRADRRRAARAGRRRS